MTISSATTNDNQYIRCKVGRIARGGRTYEFHMFYHSPQIAINYPTMSEIMIELDVVSFLSMFGILINTNLI